MIKRLFQNVFSLTLLIIFLLINHIAIAQQSDLDMNKQLSAYLPQKATVSGTKTRQLLVFNCVNSAYHSDAILWASKALELTGKKTGAYITTVSSDPSVFTAGELSKFDAVVLNNSMGNFYGDGVQEEARKKALISFVKEGKGLIAIHSSTVFGNIPNSANKDIENSYREMIVGTLVQHPWNYDELSPLTIRVEDPRHPLNAAFEGKSKWLLPFRDEIFQFTAPYSRETVRVLLSLSLEETVDKGSEPNKDYPLAWIKNYGKGRVFYSALGHSGDSFKNSRMLAFLLAGVQYALGDLKAEVSPIPQTKIDSEKGFESIFNGKNLDRWRGEDRIWSVENGCITGQTTAEERVVRNNYLIWEGGPLKDFELKTRFKLEGGNSGIYFHSFERTADTANQETLVGVQADFSADHVWVGTIMEYKLREKLADRGQKVVIKENGERIDAGSTGNPDELLKIYRENEWNDYHVIVRDNLILLRINDVVMSELRDYDKKRLVSGLLALQVHVGPSMNVQFKDIRIKKF